MKYEKYQKQLREDWSNFFEDSNEESLLLEYRQDGTILNERDKERNHLIIALAKNRNLWKWIDKTYSIRKHEYYIAYKNSFFANTPLKEVFSIHTKEYINKLAGIAYWCKNNNTEEPLLKIIQKEHNKIYSRFKVGIKEIDIDRVIAERLSKIEKETKDESELLLEKNTQLEELITVMLFLAKTYDVELDGFIWKKLYAGYLSSLFSGIGGYFGIKQSIEECDKSELTKLTEDILEIDYKKIKKCKNLHELYNLLTVEQSRLARESSIIMGMNPVMHESMDMIKEKVMKVVMSKDNKYVQTEDLMDEILERSAKEYCENIPTRDLGLLVSYFSLLPRVSGMEKEVLLDMPINMDMIFAAILYTVEDEYDSYVYRSKKITNKLRLQSLTSITIMAMFEHNKNLKLTALDNEEEIAVEVQKLASDIKEKDEEIAKLKEKIEEINKARKKEMNEVLNELELSKKNVKRLKKELEDSKENQTEFIALREYVYRNTLSESEIAVTFEDSIPLEEKINYLNERKVAIFGGHPNWVNKLKKILPNAKYIDTNAFSSRKFTRLDKYDLLVICNLFISHGLYWKVSEAIKNVKSKKVVIIDDINTDIIINNLYDAMKEYEATC